ncbi:MAG: RidA family protein [Gemmatimonadetes bacterium]|nr:RidA family protein [Gemmatimonadota bacterium]
MSAIVHRLNPPALPTPPGYSQVVTSTGGTLIVIAGQVALDAQGTLVGAGDFEAQAVQTFRNLVAALEGAGATARDLVKITTFVTDMAQLPAFRRARDRFLDPAHAPASTLVEVSRLFRPEFLIEIEGLAVRQS